MKVLNFYIKKITQPVINPFYRIFSTDNNRDISNTIFIAGSARSGTTWLAELLARNIKGRILFEPFHNLATRELMQSEYMPYFSEHDEIGEIKSIYRDILTGIIRNKWIDRDLNILRADYRVLKEIRANFMLHWLKRNFPEMPLIFILRNPCAVVASRMTAGWGADQDIETILRQPKLIADHLPEFEKSMRDAGTEPEKHAVVWSVTNLVPIRVLKPAQCRFIYYEDLQQNTVKVMREILNFCGINPDKPMHIKNDWSITASVKTVNSKNKPDSWKSGLEKDQVSRILNVVKEFKLDYLYDQSGNPVYKW